MKDLEKEWRIPKTFFYKLFLYYEIGIYFDDCLSPSEDYFKAIQSYLEILLTKNAINTEI